MAEQTSADTLLAPERLAELRRTDLLDTATEEAFDRYTRLVCAFLGVEIAFISLVDESRQFFKSETGMPEPWCSLRETPLSHSLCKSVVRSNQPLVLSDARADERFADHPAVLELGVVAYAGFPLTTASGQTLGTLCAASASPCNFDEQSLQVMRDLAASVSSEIQLRLDQAREQELDNWRRVMAAALDQMPTGVMLTTPDLKDPPPTIQWVNRAMTQITGYTEAELKGRSPKLLQGPQTDRGELERLVQTLRRGETFRGETVNYRKDGTPYDLAWSIQPVRDAEGHLLHYVSVQEEVTERKRFADTLAAFFENTARRDLPADQRINTFLEIGRRHFGLPAGVVARIEGERHEAVYVAGEGAPPVGTVLPLTDTYCAEAAGEDKVLMLDHASQEGMADSACFRRFGIEAYVGAPVYVDGALFGTLHFHAGPPSPRPFGDSDRQVLRLLAQWLGAELGRERDLAQLRSTRARLAAVIDATRDGIAPVDAEGRLVNANRAMTHIFDSDQQHLVGRELPLLFVPAARETVNGALAEVRNSDTDGGGRELEVSALRADGTPFPAELYLAPMALQDADLTLAVIRDVSKAHEAETIKNQFVSTVSHELRTPLTSLFGSLKLVQGGAAGELPPRAAGLIDMAHRNASRLLGLVNDILDFERLRTGRIEIQPRNVDLGDQLVTAKEDNTGYAEQAGCCLEVDIPSDPIPVHVDPDRLQQVFSNLISNGAKFSPEGETVHVWAEWSDDDTSVIITVRDRGQGLPDSVRDRLFQPFVQADPSDDRKHQKGTGLGLAITRSIVERMDGAIWVESQPGDTRFMIRLPMVKAAG